MSATVQASALRTPPTRRALGLALVLAALVLVVLASIAVGARSIAAADASGGCSGTPTARSEAVIVHDLRHAADRARPARRRGARPVRRADAGADPQPARRPRPARRQRRRRGRGRRRRSRRSASTRAHRLRLVRVRRRRRWRRCVVYVLGAPGAAARRPVRLGAGRHRDHRRAAARSSTAMLAARPRRVRPVTGFWDVGSLAGREPRRWPAGRAVPRRRRRARAGARPGRSTRSALGDDAGRALGAQPRPHPRARPRSPSRCCAAPRPPRPARSCSSAWRSRTSRARSPAPTSAGCCAYSMRAGAGRCCSAPTSSAGSSAGPAELQVGIVTAFLGAPVFIALVPPAPDGAAVSAPDLRRPRDRVAAVRGAAPSRCACGVARSSPRSCSSWSPRAVPAGRCHRRLPAPAARRARGAGRRRRPRRRVHRRRAAAAAGARRRCWSAPRSASAARSSRASPATRSAARTSSASPRARRPARCVVILLLGGGDVGDRGRRAGRRRW